MAGRFLKQSARLNTWANTVKSNAVRNLQGVIRTKSTGDLARSIRFFKRDRGNTVSLEFSMNWYGIDILEATYPSGKKWGRGKLKRVKRAQPWFTPALNSQLDELTTFIENEIAKDLEDIIKP